MVVCFVSIVDYETVVGVIYGSCLVVVDGLSMLEAIKVIIIINSAVGGSIVVGSVVVVPSSLNSIC